MLSALLCASLYSRAQSFFSASEYGISLGGSQYFGDLNDHYGFHYIRPAGGAFVRLLLNPYISVRGSASYTQVGYADSYNNNPYEQERNLSFHSNIVEGVLQSEFNFARFTTGEDGHRFTPYLTFGIGAFYFAPYANFGGKDYDLRALGTEGQNVGFDDRKYKRWAMCFPVGAGFKYWIVPGVNLGLEIADRLTTTDYLDDVSNTYVGADKFPNDPQTPNPAFYLQDPSTASPQLGRAGKQRGNSQTKDQYLYAQFNISFQFKVYKCPAWMKEGYME